MCHPVHVHEPSHYRSCHGHGGHRDASASPLGAFGHRACHFAGADGDPGADDLVVVVVAAAAAVTALVRQRLHRPGSGCVPQLGVFVVVS